MRRRYSFPYGNVEKFCAKDFDKKDIEGREN